jgi:hypothetical protein
MAQPKAQPHQEPCSRYGIEPVGRVNCFWAPSVNAPWLIGAYWAPAPPIGGNNEGLGPFPAYVLLMLGHQPANTPTPSGTLLVDPMVTGWSGFGSGTASSTVTMPALIDLVGARIFAQWIVMPLLPAYPPAPFFLTNAAMFVVQL